ncbi:hypothetical protein Dda_9288 [Drechslerella dactyloides]|uniref:Uncharacterized protein n=1 Tax=Drechslerella dactyloides TaxID=74499 RepID=A0AAD6IQJ9_DREDA|nr:hypothetical protein Dda_9288 [Drechslerella dactyloides]
MSMISNKTGTHAEEHWDSDPAAEMEGDEHDDRAGSKMIPMSRRIMTPQTPTREESDGNGSNGAAVGSTSYRQYSL